MPDEPMHILLNTAVSSTWGFPAPCPPGCACDCFDCGDDRCKCGIADGFCESLPAHFLIDWVRVYQNASNPAQSVGCDTPAHPTRAFIEAHRERYSDPDGRSNRPLAPVRTGGAFDPTQVRPASAASEGRPYQTAD